MFVKTVNIGIFWLKCAIMNFGRFPPAVGGDYGIGNMWNKFYLSGNFYSCQELILPA